ncbi:MAG TPA: hypothetical protein VJ572_02960, partial [Azonexus sp.]|nr:hypothetical protein [Azonexus sp.]
RNSSIYHWLSFGGGIAAAFVVRSEYVSQKLRGNWLSLVALLLLTITVVIYPSARGYVQILMLSATFVIIAAGNGCFGLLTNRLSRTLGEMAYSIYLLHGVLLFVLFRFIIGLDRSKSLSPVFHWAAIIGLTPVLIGIAFICYRKIEHPALLKTNDLTLWLRTKFSFQARAADQKL